MTIDFTCPYCGREHTQGVDAFRDTQLQVCEDGCGRAFIVQFKIVVSFEVKVSSLEEFNGTSNL